MFDLGTLYHPITASPDRCNDSYCEIKPCAALHPFVRCFWGTPMPISPETAEAHRQENSLVIPDTCMDIIFSLNYTSNELNTAFCAIDESAHQAGMQSFSGVSSTFAIRFYAWSAILFAESDLKDSRNRCFDAGEHFSGIKRRLEPMLFDVPSLRKRTEIAQDYLLSRLNRLRVSGDLMNAVYYMISTCGREQVTEAARYAAVSQKQLERLFAVNIGVSPKSFSSLVHYQLLWQDIASGGVNILDAVARYGYCDQAHLINDFRRHHLCSPMQAAALIGR